MNKEQLKVLFSKGAANARTAQDIRDAIASLPAGGAEQIADYITEFCRDMGIDPQSAEISEYYKQTTEYKAIQEEQLVQIEIDNEFNNIESFINIHRENKERGAQPTKEQRIELSEKLSKLAARIGITAVKNPFISFNQYIENHINKNWWEEFSPLLFNKLPFPDGTLSAIGAAPGGGKSAVLVNICKELLITSTPENAIYKKAQAKNAKRKILFISAEMTGDVILDRLVKCIAWETGAAAPQYNLQGINEPWDYEHCLKNIYRGSGELIPDNNEQAARTKSYKNIHDDYIRPALGNRLQIAYVRGFRTFDEISNIIRTQAEPGYIVLMDYLQLFPIMKKDTQENCQRYLQIKNIIDEAILAAEETKSVIICAAQLGRAERQNGSGKQSDDTQGWRESGDIEQSAWNLIKMFLEVNPDNPVEKQLSYRVSKARSSGHLGEAFIFDWTPEYQHIRKTIDEKPKIPLWIKPKQPKQKTEAVTSMAFDKMEKPKSAADLWKSITGESEN